MFNQNHFIMKKLFTLFAAMVTFVAVNAQSVNYSIVGFMDPNTYMITQEMQLGPTDTLIVYPIATNSGPETLTTSDTIFYHVSIENHSLDALGYIPSISTSAQEIQQYHLLEIDTLFPMMLGILLPTQMDDPQYQGYFGTDFTDFEVCVTIDFAVATEQSPADNTLCVNIIREPTVGINEIVEGEVNVYPNPATTVINIDNAEGAQVSVFDINGRMITNVESASANQTIDASNFAKGMYIVRIANGNNVITKKVSVVR